MISTPQQHFIGCINLCLPLYDSPLVIVCPDFPYDFPKFFTNMFPGFSHDFPYVLMIFPRFSHYFTPISQPLPATELFVNAAANVAGASKPTASSTACVGETQRGIRKQLYTYTHIEYPLVN